jgi:hypothetical protein
MCMSQPVLCEWMRRTDRGMPRAQQSRAEHSKVKQKRKYTHVSVMRYSMMIKVTYVHAIPRAEGVVPDARRPDGNHLRLSWWGLWWWCVYIKYMATYVWVATTERKDARPPSLSSPHHVT